MQKPKVKIAIIEDDLATVQMYCKKFEQEGYEVKIASNGTAGLQLIHNLFPDIVLLDLMLPGMSGLDVLSALKADPRLTKIKIIVLTNMDDPYIAAKVRSEGAAEYIIKAEMTPAQVMAVVKQLQES
jgi:CheY-like chemotaxis protein